MVYSIFRNSGYMCSFLKNESFETAGLIQKKEDFKKNILEFCTNCHAGLQPTHIALQNFLLSIVPAI